MSQHLHRMAVAATFLSLAGGAVAAETKVRMNGSGGVSGVSNPYLSTISAVKAMLLEMTVEPSVTRSTSTSSISLTGRAARRGYTNDLPAALGASAELSAKVRRSERLELRGAVDYSYDRSAFVIDEIIAALDPESIQIQKRAQATADIQLSQAASLSPTLAFRQVSFRKATEAQGYSTAAAGIGYSLKLNEQTAIGLRADAATQRYKNSGGATVLALLGAGQHRLDEDLLVAVRLGAEAVSLSGFNRSNSRHILPSGDATLCRTHAVLSMCLNAALQSESVGVGNLQRLFSSGLTADYRVNDRTSFAARADYNRVNPIGESQFGTLSFMSARLSMSRKISKALTLEFYSNFRHRSVPADASSIAVGTNLRVSIGQD